MIDLQSRLDEFDLMDSVTAAKFTGLSPATLRNPKNKYLSKSVKIGQYRFWQREELIKIQNQHSNKTN